MHNCYHELVMSYCLPQGLRELWICVCDSGGECGVAYESYFPMPAVSKDKPWYSIEQGTIHFIVMSTEHEWSEKSEQV